MKVKTIVVFDTDELNMIDSVQTLMRKYMTKIEETGDPNSDLYKSAQKVFTDIDYFFVEYEEFDPNRI